jgi:hypothetical protein
MLVLGTRFAYASRFASAKISGVPRRIRTSIAFLLREAPLPIGLPGQTRGAHLEPAGGIKPPSHPYERGALSLNYAGAVLQTMKIDKWTGSASHPQKGGSCTMPRPIFRTFTMSYSSILADRSSKFRGNASPSGTAPQCLVRSRTWIDRRHYPAHAVHARTAVVSVKVVFLAIIRAVLALLPVWRRVFGPCRRLFRSS